VNFHPQAPYFDPPGIVNLIRSVVPDKSTVAFTRRLVGQTGGTKRISEDREMPCSAKIFDA
jgi:hypothetical protein